MCRWFQRDIHVNVWTLNLKRSEDKILSWCHLRFKVKTTVVYTHFRGKLHKSATFLTDQYNPNKALHPSEQMGVLYSLRFRCLTYAYGESLLSVVQTSYFWRTLSLSSGCTSHTYKEMERRARSLCWIQTDKTYSEYYDDTACSSYQHTDECRGNAACVYNDDGNGSSVFGCRNYEEEGFVIDLMAATFLFVVVL